MPLQSQVSILDSRVDQRRHGCEDDQQYVAQMREDGPSMFQILYGTE
jgi:hypothetical protein